VKAAVVVGLVVVGAAPAVGAALRTRSNRRAAVQNVTIEQPRSSNVTKWSYASQYVTFELPGWPSVTFFTREGTGRTTGRDQRPTAHRSVDQPPARVATATQRAARLQGRFQLRGRVTVARAMAGEHVGEIVIRTWTFTPGCASGACHRVLLVRSRARGGDRMILTERAPGYYAGGGAFYAPLRCQGRSYAHGELVPFTITVRITAAAPSSGTITATAVSASYTNSTRTNLTPCVQVHRHDAAFYTGRLVASARRRVLRAGAARQPDQDRAKESGRVRGTYRDAAEAAPMPSPSLAHPTQAPAQRNATRRVADHVIEERRCNQARFTPVCSRTR